MFSSAFLFFVVRGTFAQFPETQSETSRFEATIFFLLPFRDMVDNI
jgi:hypothetical protein